METCIGEGDGKDRNEKWIMKGGNGIWGTSMVQWGIRLEMVR